MPDPKMLQLPMFNPGSQEILAQALAELRTVTQDWESKRPKKPLTLFLEGHYPFFDKKVQRILMERHPECWAAYPGAPGYAVDAYIWAEQYVWTSYDDSPLRSCAALEEFADFYFVHDLSWFARLLASIAAAVEKVLRFGAGGATLETRLQSWRNARSDFRADPGPPSTWLEGTHFLGCMAKSTKPKAMNSIRATASRINHDHKDIFRAWYPVWKHALEQLEQQLKRVAAQR